MTHLKIHLDSGDSKLLVESINLNCNTLHIKLTYIIVEAGNVLFLYTHSQHLFYEVYIHILKFVFGSNVNSELDTWEKSGIFMEECSTGYAQIKQSKHNSHCH